MTITDELIDRLEKALRDYDMELLGCYDVHPEAYENDVEAPEHRRAFVDHMLKLAHPDLLDALAAERTARLAAESDPLQKWRALTARAEAAEDALEAKDAEIAGLVAGLEQIEAGLPAGSTLTAPDSALWRDAYRDLQRIARVALKDAQTVRALEDTP